MVIALTPKRNIVGSPVAFACPAEQANRSVHQEAILHGLHGRQVFDGLPQALAKHLRVHQHLDIRGRDKRRSQGRPAFGRTVCLVWSSMGWLVQELRTFGTPSTRGSSTPCSGCLLGSRSSGTYIIYRHSRKTQTQRPDGH